MEFINQFLHGEAKAVLSLLPSQTYRCCVTSPPYWGQRDYGTGEWIGGEMNCKHKFIKVNKKICKCGAVYEDEQIGLEETPEIFIERLADVFDEVKRVLTNDGTLWLNIGDTYISNNNGHAPPKRSSSPKDYSNTVGSLLPHRHTQGIYKNKDLVGIPWMLAFELRKRGWYLRTEIIWHKPNVLPESVKDRPTRTHEYIFLLSKSEKYFYDYKAIREPTKYDGRENVYNGSKKYNTDEFRPNNTQHSSIGRKRKRWTEDKDGNFVRNKRNLWSIPTKPSFDEHHATYPTELIDTCIKAGSETGDLVLDPFVGTGTTAFQSLILNRRFTGIDLNYKNIKISKTKVSDIVYF